MEWFWIKNFCASKATIKRVEEWPTEYACVRACVSVCVRVWACACVHVCVHSHWNPPIPLVGMSICITTLEMSESQMAGTTVIQVSFESLPVNPFSSAVIFYMNPGSCAWLRLTVVLENWFQWQLLLRILIYLSLWLVATYGLSSVPHWLAHPWAYSVDWISDAEEKEFRINVLKPHDFARERVMIPGTKLWYSIPIIESWTV